MPDAPEIKIQITAEDQGVAAAIKNLTANLTALKDKQAEVAGSTTDLKGAMQGLISVLAIEQFAAFGKQVFDSGVKIAKLAQVTGISAETLSVYAQATKNAGGDVDAMKSGIDKLALVVTQSEQGNQRSAKALALIGLSAKDFIGLNFDQKLRKVTDTLASMPPGAQKVAAANKLLGDGAESLLLAFQELAGDGFDRVKQQAEEMGTLLSTQTAQDLLATEGALKSLKESAEGVTQQFENGFLPALTDVANALVASVAGKGGDGFKSLGAIAGSVFKFIVEVAMGAADTLGRNAALIGAHVMNLMVEMKNLVTQGLKAAGTAYEQSEFADEQRINADFDAREAAIEGQLQNADARNQAAQAAREAKAKVPTGKDPGLVDQSAEQAALKKQEQNDAKYALAQSSQVKAITSGLELLKSEASQREAIDKSSFDRGIITLTEYYASRKSELERAGVQEIAALKEQIAIQQATRTRANLEAARDTREAGKPGMLAPEQMAYQAQAAKEQETAARATQAIAELTAKITLTSSQTAAKMTEEDESRRKATVEQALKLAGYTKEISDLQGQTTIGAKAEAAAKREEYATLLASAPNATKDDSAAKLAKYDELITAVATYNETRVQGETAMKALDDARAEIELKVKSGQIFEVQGQQLIRAEEAKRLPGLRAIQQAELAAAIASGNEADKQAALDFGRALDQVGLDANQAEQQMATLKKGIESGLTGPLEQFFDSGIEHARNMQQAFAGLADSIVSSIQKMVTHMLIQIATQKLMAAFHKTSEVAGGAPKIAEAQAAGTAQALPLQAAALALKTSGIAVSASGTGIVTGATALGVSSSGLMTAAAALSLAAIQLEEAATQEEMASAASGGMAGGGQVPGRGSSDSVHAMLTPGEFVLRTAAVRAIGVTALHAMNRGLSISAPITMAAPARFAEGGLVAGTGAGSSPAHVHMQIGLEEGLVVKHMASRAGGKVVINHLANNPKSAAKAIGRSS